MNQQQAPVLAVNAAAELTEARLQIHWAVQILAAVGDALVEPQEDDGHSNFEWMAHGRRFVGRPASEPPPTRVALRPADLTLEVLAGEDRPAASSFSLAGHGLEEALDWTAATLDHLRGAPLPRRLELRSYEMPSHPVSTGAAFEIDHPAAFAEAAAWYDSGDRILKRLIGEREGATSVRCWPHHFDLATLIELASENGEDGDRPSIGIGVLLGDDSYPEPYWYVNRWPAPENPETPPLAAGGQWHTEGFFGAVLTSSQLAGASSMADQEGRIESFLTSALEALGA